MAQNLTDITRLASDRGCTFNMLCCDNAVLYWVENCLFIGKPYYQLEDLITVLLQLPLFDSAAETSFCSIG